MRQWPSQGLLEKSTRPLQMSQNIITATLHPFPHLKRLSHGQKCLHLSSESEAYHEQIPAQIEA